ncbi:MAG: GntR family transcriptional regulator [bacterium]
MKEHRKYGSSKEKAYKLIKETIIARTFAPGQFLSENELSRAFGVSRTPIREALQTLEVEGFVRLIPRKGAQVAGISIKDVDEVYELRLVLERLAGQKLIQRQDEISIQIMNDVLKTQVRIMEENDPVKFISADREFHLALIRAARNERLYRFYDGLRDHMLRLGIEAVQSPGRYVEVIEEHRAVMAGLEEGCYEAFAQAIGEHIRVTKFRVGKNLPNLWMESEQCERGG